jgi:excisionase family DNA binding protein
MFDDRLALSVTEAAKASGYTPSYIRRNVREGKLKGSRLNGRGDYRIMREDFIAWLRGEPQSSTAA